MRIKNKLIGCVCLMVSVSVVTLGIFCVSKRAAYCLDIKTDTALVAAYLMMPDGSVYYDEDKNSEKEIAKKSVNSEVADSDTENSSSKEKVRNTKKNKNEATYPINEVNLSGGHVYENVSMKNSTGFSFDVKEKLEGELPFEMQNSRQAQVLIVHTHTCESYMDEDSGFYYESFYPRTTDNDKNVTAVGEKIAKSLKEHNIGVVHAKTQHDYPSYDGAYSRSYDTIMEYLDKYERIKVVLDIHRDSMTTDNNERLKPTFTYDGKKAAQIMIMTGYDESYSYFPFWEDNLNFALKLQNTCEGMYEGMTRPLNFGDFTYNMNVNSGSLLIEVGTDANTLDEALLSGELLGNALAKVLQKQ